jgi:hypothetical protein
MKKLNKREKHPYYDSDKKKRTETAALKVTAFCIIGMVVTILFAYISKLIG